MLLVLAEPDLERLAQIVREETGNQIQEKNFLMLEARMRTYVGQLGFTSMAEYWDHFQIHGDLEREVLKGLMTTHYTFFFREFLHFEMLEKWIAQEAPRLQARYKATQSPVRIWSAACSRGQEGYSLAMFVEICLTQKLGIPFEILCSDIDAESVAYAQNGVYPLQEVTTIPHKYLNDFWRRGSGPIKDFAAVHSKLKNKMRFETANLLELPDMGQTGKFDVIFCRNVFIYFSADKVKKIALELAARLEPDGLFVSGMSEPLRFPEWTLSSIGPAVYRNKSLLPAPSSVASVAPDSPAQYRVLCVDDSPTIQRLMKKIFSQDALCKKVDLASNGKDARTKLDAGHYDIITLDIHMPEVNGIEFLEKLYNRQTDPPVLMVSSVNRSDVDLATKALSLGACDYVEKPAMNNLKKCAQEILTKTKMALRTRSVSKERHATAFDFSIARKIVVPDASQCLRVVVASTGSNHLLEQVVRGQKNEYRSPALLIIWSSPDLSAAVSATIMGWTERPVVELRGGKQTLKPNHLFLASAELCGEIFASISAKSLSLQVLTNTPLRFDLLKGFSAMQVLLDESLGPSREAWERTAKVRVADVTPATSFSSLSVEFFAQLRKAA